MNNQYKNPSRCCSGSCGVPCPPAPPTPCPPPRPPEMIGIIGPTGPAAPSIYAQHGNCRNHAAFHYLKDN